MASIIKVNQIQDSGGNAIMTSDGSGNVTPGNVAQGTIPATSIGAGAVLQVKQAALSYTTTSSTTYASAGSLSITPNSASNKILITTLNHIYVNSYSTDAWRGGLQKILRDSTEILSDGGNYGESALLVGNSDRYMCYSALHYLDSPNTTSAVTYDMQIRSKVSGHTVYFNRTTYGSGGRITLMEIAG